VKTIRELRLLGKNLPTAVAAELARTGGLLRVAPCCVARSFLQSGKRRKLHPDISMPSARPAGASMNAGSPRPPRRPTGAECQARVSAAHACLHPTQAHAPLVGRFSPQRSSLLAQVEDFFGRIKRYRRVGTHYDRLAIVFLGLVQLAAVVDWLTHRF